MIDRFSIKPSNRFSIKMDTHNIWLCDGENGIPDIPFPDMDSADYICDLLNEAEQIKSDFKVLELKHVLDLFKENNITLTADIVKQALESVYNKRE